MMEFFISTCCCMQHNDNALFLCYKTKYNWKKNRIISSSLINLHIINVCYAEIVALKVINAHVKTVRCSYIDLSYNWLTHFHCYGKILHGLESKKQNMLQKYAILSLISRFWNNFYTISNLIIVTHLHFLLFLWTSLCYIKCTYTCTV